MATQSLILQPGGHKMPLLGFGTWKVDKNSTADVVYKVTLNIDEGEKKSVPSRYASSVERTNPPCYLLSDIIPFYIFAGY